MRVSELIEKLKKMPQDMDVYVYDAGIVTTDFEVRVSEACVRTNGSESYCKGVCLEP